MDDNVRAANPHDSLGTRAVAAADAYSKAGRGGVSHPLMFEAFRAGYLAGASDQNPADDGEVVTEEWLRSVGHPPAIELRDLKRYDLRGDSIHILAEACPGPECWRYCIRSANGSVLIDRPTRGQFRRLCAVINIPLSVQ